MIGKKVIVVLAVIAAIALIVQQAYKASTLRSRVQILEQHLDQLRSERDGMASELISLRNENGRLSRNASELPKLRAEVAQLRINNRMATSSGVRAEGSSSKISRQTETDDEANLDDQQRVVLADWTEKLKTGNSVDDLDRLRDSLNRWDELFMEPAPPELKPVFAILKKRMRDRIAELEKN